MKRSLFGWFFTFGLVTAAFGQAVQTWQYSNITLAAPTTTVVKLGPGVLHNVCNNTPNAGGTAQLYDGTAATGTKIGLLTSVASKPFCVTYDVAFWTSLTIVTATAAADWTVSFR
jgi:hypothetical protein